MKPVKSIVVLTGAGISAESGIKTFRADDGLWEDHKVEDVATPEAFERDPWLVQKFYNERRRPLLNHQVQPNSAHQALAKLEREFEGDFMLVTQNIDNLHELGGSTEVLHMHGEVLKMRCKQSSRVFDCYYDIEVADLCDCCGKPNHLRPHIVWFGEMPLYMDEISSAISKCDLFISIGTSGNVYPAAGFVQIAKQSGATTLEVNLQKSLIANDFDQAVYGKAGAVLPLWVDQFLAESNSSEKLP
ncbi:MAG: NAD-dependent deacetylase [Arenicella sp.]|jgi:NAD-dependent deacetylase